MRALIPLLLLSAAPAAAQIDTTNGGGRIQILGADKWTFDEKLAPGAQRLIGHARFQHAGAVMSCDSAYIHDDQSVQAFGHIGIRQGDTLTISGDRLDYSGQERLATITGKVRLSDKDMDLSTEALTYDLRSRTAIYTGGGTIVSRKENNTLTSDRGSYLAAAHRFIFSGHVVLLGPDRAITGDTLHYTTTSGIAQFFGPTTITSGRTHMWCTRGTYDTRKEVAHFTRRARVLTDGQELQGDSLHYERGPGIGLAWGHVLMTDTANDMQVRGEVGRYEEGAGRSWVTGRAELVMGMGTDSLYLHGDTLFAEKDSVGRRITARRNVRFFKSDLSGVCDTMIYAEQDSTIQLLSHPAVWSGDDQITGKRVSIAMRDGKAHRLYVEEDAFLCSQVDSSHFDQVTGTNMTGYFEENELRRLIAEGNCRTVYFAREEASDSTDEKASEDAGNTSGASEDARANPKLMGMNRVDCSRIQVDVHAGDVDIITFLAKPDGTMYPVAKAPEEEKHLRGFLWRGDERPTDRGSIFK